MKLDKIIMNPPYSGNLHLKILSHLINEYPEAEVVNLSPVDFISDLGKYNGWNKDGDVDFCLSHTEELEILDHRFSNDIFGLGNQIDRLGIWKISQKGTGLNITNYRKPFDVKLAQKAYNTKPSLWSKYKRHSDVTKDYVVDVYKWHEEENPVNCIIVPDGVKKNNSYVLEFDTQEEVLNFKSSIGLKLMRYIIGTIHIYNPAHLPYLGDYTHPWTDQQLFDYFHLTKEEIREIEKCI